MKTLVPSREIQRLDFGLFHKDPDNTRRKYSPDALAELAESIYHDGVIQNLEAGPDGRVHLGNRRLYATADHVIPRLEREIAEAEASGDPDGRLAELRSRLEDRRLVPVRVLSSEEVRDAKVRQIVENLQREEVSARDEAEGYARLLEERDEEGKPRWTPESIAARIGKEISGRYVSNRLRLLRSTKEALDALEEGLISVRVAELIGRVPNEAVRKEYSARVLRPRFSDRPLNEKEALELLREEYMISLKGSTFDQEDLDLVPEAGGCRACPYRSGNDPSLAGEIQAKRDRAGIPPDLCTNPACFRKKADAAWNRVAASAEASGFDVLDDAAAEKVFNYHSGELAWNAAWIDLESRPDHEFTGDYETRGKPKWRAILKDSGIRITKARNPVNGKVVELVPKAVAREAVKMILASSKESPAPASGKAAAELFRDFSKKADREATAKAEAAKLRRESKIKQAAAIAGADAILDAMTSEPEGPIDREALLAVLEIVLDDSADACSFVALWFELERPHAGASGRDYLPSILERVRANDYTAKELFAFVAFASVARALKWNGVEGRDVKKLAKVIGVDLVAAAKEARAKFIQEEREKEKAKKAKVAVVPPEERSLLGDDNPNASLDEVRLIALEIAIQLSDLETVDLDFFCGRPSAFGALNMNHAERLWKELEARGVVDADGRVLEIPYWRKDAVGNRRANDFYEARLEAGAPVSIAEVEKRFGLKANALATYRKNQNRGKGGSRS